VSGAAQGGAPLVDTHFHVYTRDMPLSATAWHKPPEDATIERLIATLDAHGVQFGVLAPASLYGDYNEYTREALRRHPDRLRASAIVKTDIAPGALKALRADGFIGLRFQFRDRKDPPDLATPEYKTLLKRIADLGWIVHLHDHGARLAPAIRLGRNCVIGPGVVVEAAEGEYIASGTTIRDERRIHSLNV